MQRVLVIGATSSIAADISRRLSSRGAALFLIARNIEKLTALQEELGSSIVGVEAYDFNKVEESGPALNKAFSVLGQVDLVLIAHGRLGDQRLSEKDYEEAYQTTHLNYLSVVAQLLIISDALETQGSGQIAVISSVAGLRGRPKNYTYGAAKAALTTYLQGLRSRLYPAISVTTVLLGPVDTPMTIEHEKNWLFLSSTEAARRILQAIDRKKGDVYIPGIFRAILLVVKSLPEAIFQRFSSISGR